jgi:hypothetical protein
MAHRGGPLERRWSERTLAQPGPDERAEGFGYFARKVTRPGGRNQKHQQKRGNAERSPKDQNQHTPISSLNTEGNQGLTQTCQSDITKHVPP